jgi:hypothetical protein
MKKEVRREGTTGASKVVRTEKETADLSTPAALCRKTFPGKVRRTADPSASVGMTKGRATVS